MKGFVTVHIDDGGGRCENCGKAWPCQGYTDAYQDAMRERNAAADAAWSNPEPAEK